MPLKDAETVADVLVQADLWGITTHGVSNYIKGIYVPLLLDKTITSNPTIKILSEGSSVALLDGDGGMGHVISVQAMELAIEKALESGIGAVSVTNSTHFGAAGVYSHMAAEKNMIGISMTNAAPRVVPLYGKNAMLGTNPLSIAAPTNKEHPFLLDMATSTVSAGKLYVAALNGGMIPEGWATNVEGQPTSDPVEGLDASILQNHLLAPILNIDDPRTNNRIDFVGGIRGLRELERRCTLDAKIAFALYPVSIDNLLAVADAGKVMPPKSTWFEPKLRSGMVVRLLE